eukprot:526581-Pelagomonas_calceolata.AAC.1
MYACATRPLPAAVLYGPNAFCSFAVCASESLSHSSVFWCTPFEAKRSESKHAATERRSYHD